MEVMVVVMRTENDEATLVLLLATWSVVSNLNIGCQPVPSQSMTVVALNKIMNYDELTDFKHYLLLDTK